MEDAMACANIAIEATKKLQVNDFSELLKKTNLKVTRFEHRAAVSIS